LGLGAVLRDRPFGYAGVEIQGVRGHYFTNFGQMIRCGNGAVLAASRPHRNKTPLSFQSWQQCIHAPFILVGRSGSAGQLIVEKLQPVAKAVWKCFEIRPKSGKKMS
jgi:hypothetical protein